MQDTLQVAQQLLGKVLVLNKNNIALKGKIVETEAYLGEKDLACHANKGKTQRTYVMYGPPGHSYVYLIYGIYHMFNVITQPTGQPEAVLIRALEPLQELDSMQAQFQKKLPKEKLCNGPGKLTKAFDITKKYNTHDLLKNPLFIEYPSNSMPFQMIQAKRIGISYAQTWQDKLFRFYIKDHPSISKK